MSLRYIGGLRSETKILYFETLASWNNDFNILDL